ncbi:hypothetical protein TRFO_24642 [Tritrichomonas foetus]|uniref:Protein kinase domain-containing protein n=1 Tax=Tritrichomonas foetus TaxID=1144522 RepID=A0A1J4K8M9_9EUKA|nr:hypothetical protein TRFO_24642 [Tritrichomonas foetus]|eukprot:OHT07240.1 hypothetical protein TRFO_24642 [Tritrichomonas foetus]
MKIYQIFQYSIFFSERLYFLKRASEIHSLIFSPDPMDALVNMLAEHQYQHIEQIGKGHFSTVHLVFSEKYNMEFVAKVMKQDPSEMQQNKSDDSSDNCDHNNSSNDPKNNLNNQIPKKAINQDDESERKSKPKHKTIQSLADDEIRVHTQLHHPNVLSVYDYFVDGEFLVIILEYCPNGTLDDYLKRNGPIRPPELYSMCYQLLQALNCCHQHGIAHRDIKPQNILIDNYMRPKLSDFGLSGKFQIGRKISQISGSRAFLSPGALTSGQYDPFQSDIWAMGVTFYIMACGYLPWPLDNAKEMLLAIKMALVPFDNDASHALSADFKRMIKSMLQPDPSKRITLEQLLNHEVFEHEQKIGIVPQISLKSIKTSGSCNQVHNQKRALNYKRRTMIPTSQSNCQFSLNTSLNSSTINLVPKNTFIHEQNFVQFQKSNQLGNFQFNHNESVSNLKATPFLLGFSTDSSDDDYKSNNNCNGINNIGCDNAVMDLESIPEQIRPKKRIQSVKSFMNISGAASTIRRSNIKNLIATHTFFDESEK